MAGVAESKYGDSLDVSSIKLVNNPTNIHNRIRRNITKTKNAYKRCLCGDACSPHLLKVSRHYGVVVKCFASGQCGPARFDS